jgi:hypothetical protein
MGGDQCQTGAVAMKKYVWSFVIAVAMADSAFTWVFRHSALEWESNPAATEIISRLGAPGAIAYRFACLAFAGSMARTNTRLSWVVTPVWGIGHLYLLVVLCRALPYALVIAG